MKNSLLLIFFLFFEPLHATGKIQSIKFDSLYAPSNFTFPEKLSSLRPAFDTALETFPESLLITTAIQNAGLALGLSPQQVQKIGPIFAEIYSKIEADSDFSGIHSVLPYCLDNDKIEGHYFLYTPKEIKTAPILFLHGYGGNPLFYLWTLKTEFPNSIIICPSSGVGWDRNSNLYLKELMKSLAKKKIPTNKMWLMALSQGGPAGFKYYSSQAKQIKGFFSIASYPKKEQLKTIKKGSSIYMINGLLDKRASYSFILPRINRLKKNPHITFGELALEADHFFFVSQREKLFSYIKAKMNRINAKKQ